MSIDFTNLAEVIAWLNTGVGLAAVAVAISDLMRNLTWEKWVELSGKAKLAIMVGMYAVVGAAAFAIETYVPGAVLAAIQPFWSQAVMLFLSGRIFFEIAKEK